MNGPQGDRRMEELLARAAQEFVYPPTPALAARVGAALAARRADRARPLFPALRWAAVVLAIVLGLTLAVPQTRAALYRVLQIGVVRIFLAETPTPSAAPTPLPTPLPEYYVSLDQLAGETTLEDAAARTSAPLLLPTYPAELGLPDRVFVNDTAGESVILVWLAEEGTTEDRASVELALFALGRGVMVEKVQPQVVRTTTVRGRPALWATGPYLVTLRSGNLDFRRLTGGHVLIWEENGITYRLETQADLEEARRIAASLEPFAEE